MPKISILNTFLTAVCGHTALRAEIYKFYECRRSAPPSSGALRHLLPRGEGFIPKISVLNTFLTAVCGHTALRAEIYKSYECRWLNPSVTASQSLTYPKTLLFGRAFSFCALPCQKPVQKVSKCCQSFGKKWCGKCRNTIYRAIFVYKEKC